MWHKIAALFRATATGSLAGISGIMAEDPVNRKAATLFLAAMKATGQELDFRWH
jgi:hypothetical protein